MLGGSDLLGNLRDTAGETFSDDQNSTARTEHRDNKEVALLTPDIHFHVSLWDSPPCVFLPILIGW